MEKVSAVRAEKITPRYVSIQGDAETCLGTVPATLFLHKYKKYRREIL